MRIFFGTTPADTRRSGRLEALRPRGIRGAALRRWRELRSGRRGEDGFMLIEVMVSALLVALVVVATFNGFDVATRFTADQRRHDQAVLLAAQSQEQLRSDPATTLDALETSPHTYTATVNNTVYTITQEAKAVAASGNSTGCNVSEASAQSGGNVLITSIVTWALLEKAKRPAVTASSVVTPPVGSAIEVDVTNGGSPEKGVAGVTATAKFIPVEAKSQTSAEATTGAAGCVVLGGLAATTATVEIAEKAGFVTSASWLKWPTKELTIAPNFTTHYPVKYAEAGQIQAEWTYEGKNTFEGKAVQSDTFAVSNAKMLVAPEFVVGSTAFEYPEAAPAEKYYKAVTGTYASEVPAAATPGGQLRFPKGNLFPFAQEWLVVAGDCPKNAINAEAESKSEKRVVASGTTLKVQVPLSKVKLEVWKGTQASHPEKDPGVYEVKTTDTECEGVLAPNGSTGAVLTHLQKTEPSGGLQVPFQPFGKASLCLYVPSTKRTYTVTYNNATAKGNTKAIYTGEATEAEVKEKRLAEEAAAKKAREEAEATAKKKREEEEPATKKARETKETEERTLWKKQEEKKEITKAQRTEKETAQKKNKEKEEAKEAETKKKAEEAEATKKKTEETKETEKRKAAETKEAEEKAKKEVSVASGKASC
jgi:Tfp pilus assembly protein PilV